MNYIEYRKLLKNAKTDYENTVASIHKVWSMYHEKFISNMISMPCSTKTGFVKKVLNSMPDNFTVDDMFNYLQNTHKDFKIKKATLSNILLKFYNSKIIGIKKRGKGRLATIYMIIKGE